jgi:hypothetical protein
MVVCVGLILPALATGHYTLRTNGRVRGLGVECRATRALSGIMIKAGLYSEKLWSAIFSRVQVWGVMPFYQAIYMA